MMPVRRTPVIPLLLNRADTPLAPNSATATTNPLKGRCHCALYEVGKGVLIMGRL